MRRLAVTAPGEWAIGDVPEPEPTASEVLVAPLLVGVCATDAEILAGTLIYQREGRATLPQTPGHEWVGRVVRSALGFEAGEIVVGECSVGCGACALCADGRYHLCERRTETGIIGRGGALTELMAFPAAALHRVPATVDVQDAALTEPTAVALHAVQRSGATVDSTVLVVGGGTIGYLVAMILVAERGAAVAMIDPVEEQLARAGRIGVRPVLEGESFSVVIEASGHPGGLATAIASAAPGARVVLVGLSGRPEVPAAIDRIVVSELDVVGSIGSPGVWPDVLLMVERGRVQPSRVVSEVLPLDAFGLAIDRLATGVTGKVLIDPQLRG